MNIRNLIIIAFLLQAVPAHAQESRDLETALRKSITYNNTEILERLLTTYRKFNVNNYPEDLNYKTQPLLMDPVEMDPVEDENGNFIGYYFGGYEWLFDQITLDTFDLYKDGNENILENVLSWYFSGYGWLYDQARELIKE